MKKRKGSYFEICVFFLIGLSLNAQQVFNEDFTNGTVGNSVTAAPISWDNNGSGNGTFLIANVSSLTYSGYNGGGGNYLLVTKSTNNISNVGASFNPTVSSSTNTFYYSFLLNVSTAPSSENYFAGFATTINGTISARLYMKSASGGYNLGIAKSSGVQAYGTSPSLLTTGTTYLIIVKYVYVTGSTNDQAYLWINHSNSSEPLTANAEASDAGSTTDGAALSSNGVFTLRNTTGSANYSIDGIKVAYGAASADAWTNLNPGALPVELTSFTSNVIDNKVKLNWTTAIEVNNYGFEILRRVYTEQSEGAQNDNWEKIGFVQGHGNSNSPKNYSFTDKPTRGKEFQYRLKQIDFNGAFEYSEITTAILENVNEFKLAQNYPNPFNPVTRISYTLPMRSNVKLRVYDLLAQKVAELVDGIQEAGRYEVTFDGSNLPSGAYFYKLEAGNHVEVKKLLLVK